MMGSCARTEPSGPSARQALAAGPWHHLCASVYWHFDLHSSTGAFPGGARVWRKRGMTGWQLMGPAYFLPGLAVRGLSRAGHGQGGVRCSQGAACCWGGATGLHPSPLGMRNVEFGPVPTPWLWESDRPPWAPSREGAARALWGGGEGTERHFSAQHWRPRALGQDLMTGAVGPSSIAWPPCAVPAYGLTLSV